MEQLNILNLCYKFWRSRKHLLILFYSRIISRWHRRLRENSIELIDKYKVRNWFRTIPFERAYAREIIHWIHDKVSKDGLIVEIGCGIGQNFIEMSRYGFHNFLGADSDENAIACAKELLSRYGLKADLRVQDGRSQLNLNNSAVLIMPLNWTYFVPDLNQIFSNTSSDLISGGFLIIDIISDKYLNQYYVQDGHHSVDKHQFIEYPYRYSANAVEKIGRDYDLRLLKSKEYYPRIVMYFQKL